MDIASSLVIIVVFNDVMLRDGNVDIDKEFDM